jgi:hypothetical protein
MDHGWLSEGGGARPRYHPIPQPATRLSEAAAVRDSAVRAPALGLQLATRDRPRLYFCKRATEKGMPCQSE